MAAAAHAAAVHIAPLAAGGAARQPAKPFPLKALAGYVNGQWVQARSGATAEVTNPADGTVVARVPDMGAEDTQAAIDAAAAAFPGWAARTAFERSAILRKFYDLVMSHTEGLAVLLSLEAGKPLEEAKGEIKYAADFLEWYAEEGKRPAGEVLQAPRGDRRMLVTVQPVGPCALLTPWNFPAAMPTRKIGPALAAGCTMVFRPSANTPLTAIALVQLAEQAGVPPGVLNLVIGHDHAATAGVLTASPAIRKLSFTGSTRVGKELMAACAPSLKRLSLELGGQAPFIVFEDADIDAAVEGALASKFRNAGQTCVCANAFFVQEAVYEAFVSKLAARVAALKVGDGLTPGVHIGPVITERALRATEQLVADAVARGARVRVGGKRLADEVNGGKGWFYAPTLLEGVPSDAACVTSEIFGPIAPVVRFKDEAEVLRQANAASVGLAGYFYTKDLSRAWRVADALQVGMVGVNTGLISAAHAPFGGVKESGYGREGARQGLAEYVNLKYVMMGL